MPNLIAVTHPATGRTIHVPPAQVQGLKAAGWFTTTAPADDNATGTDDVDGQIPDRAVDIVAWIGDNPDRAAHALAVENERADPRTTVLDHIHTLVTTEPKSEED